MLEEAHGCVDADVRAHDARDGHGDGLDTAEEVAWEIHVEGYLGDVKGAGSCFSQGDERVGIELPQGDGFRDLVVVPPTVLVRDIHLLQRQVQLAAGLQAVAGRVEVAEGDEVERLLGRGGPALEAERLLGLFGKVVGEEIRLVHGRARAPLQPFVQLVIGVLVLQKLADLVGVVDVLLLVGYVLVGHLDACFLRCNLRVDVLEFEPGEVHLVEAFLCTSHRELKVIDLTGVCLVVLTWYCFT